MTDIQCVMRYQCVVKCERQFVMRGVEDKKTGDKDDCIQDCKKPKFASSVEKYKRGRLNMISIYRVRI